MKNLSGIKMSIGFNQTLLGVSANDINDLGLQYASTHKQFTTLAFINHLSIQQGAFCDNDRRRVQAAFDKFGDLVRVGYHNKQVLWGTDASKSVSKLIKNPGPKTKGLTDEMRIISEAFVAASLSKGALPRTLWQFEQKEVARVLFDLAISSPSIRGLFVDPDSKSSKKVIRKACYGSAVEITGNTAAYRKMCQSKFS